MIFVPCIRYQYHVHYMPFMTRETLTDSKNIGRLIVFLLYSWNNNPYSLFISIFKIMRYDSDSTVSVEESVCIYSFIICVCVCVCVCVCDRNYKRCMEYLFYVPDPEHSCESDEIIPILENGFKTADAYKVQNPSKPGEDWLWVSVVFKWTHHLVHGCVFLAFRH